jgi:hypothetical protein
VLFPHMFLNLLSIYVHFQVLNTIDVKYSVSDVLLILSRIKVYQMEKSEIMSEVQKKKANDLVESLGIDLNMLCKNQ